MNNSASILSSSDDDESQCIVQELKKHSFKFNVIRNRSSLNVKNKVNSNKTKEIKKNEPQNSNSNMDNEEVLKNENIKNIETNKTKRQQIRFSHSNDIRYPSILKNKINPNKEQELKRLQQQQQLNDESDDEESMMREIKKMQKKLKIKGRRVRLPSQVGYKSK